MTGASSPARSAVRTVGTLGLLTAALPANLALTGAALVGGRLVGGRPGRRTPPAGARPEVAATPLTVLVTGGKMTKALQLARSFHAAGHRVVLVESAKYRLTGHRFSRAVDRFVVVPDPGAAGYVEALLTVVEQEGVDVFVPVCSPVASHYDALAKQALSEHCEVVHVGPELLEQLDDKHEFFRTARSIGLPVPDTHRVTDAQQVLDLLDGDLAGRSRPYILKSIAYDPVHRLDLTRLPRPTPAETASFVRSLPISADNPWILQEFVEGQEYCTHSTVRDGTVTVWCCCESSASQLNYEMVDKPEIRSWVERFVAALDVTGQASFDFIETPGGELFAIECNPRTHSAITMLYDHPGVAAGYLGGDGAGSPSDPGDVVEPTATSRPTYWIYHEAWRLLTKPGRADRLRTIARGKDAIFAWDDPLPFLLVHHLQVPALLIGNLRRGGEWVKIDFNIGKLVEPAGD